MTVAEPIRLKISHSEIELFQKCKRAHLYSYGYSIMGTSESVALTRGIIGHAIMRDYWLGLQAGEDYDTLTNSLLEKIFPTVMSFDVFKPVDLAADLVRLMADYFEVNKERDLLIDVIEVEKEYKIPIGNDFFVHMYVDLICRVPGVSGVSVWDHKFSYDFLSEEDKNLQPQLARYIGALMADGYVIKNAFYHELRYRVTNEGKLDPSTYFRLSPVQITRERVERSMLEFIGEGEEAAEYKKLADEEWRFNARRSATKNNCRSCSFTQICSAELHGQGTELMLSHVYQPRKHRDAND